MIDPSRAWMTIGIGAVVLVFVGRAIYTGKVFAGGFSSTWMLGWSYRRQYAVAFWAYVAIWSALGLSIIGLGIAGMLLP